MALPSGGFSDKNIVLQAKYAIYLTLDQTLSDAGALIFLSNVLKPWTLENAPENRFEYNTYRVINRTTLCDCSFSTGPYYQSQTMLIWQGNAAATDTLFSNYYVFNIILFDYIKT